MSDKKRLNVLGVGVDTAAMKEAAETLVVAMDGGSVYSVYTPIRKLFYMLIKILNTVRF